MITATSSCESTGKDEELIGECLLGNEKAWSALIARYTKLIFSIAVKRGFSQDEAADVFQTVCLTLLRELPRLRQPGALPAWLIQLTSHACSRFKAQKSRSGNADLDESTSADSSALPDELALKLERRGLVHEALRDLSPECRQLIDLLFFTSPPLRYTEAAAALGLAKGSMGATRMRCLEKLRRSIEMKGLR